MLFGRIFGRSKVLSRTTTDLCRAIRRLFARRGLTITAAARAAGLPRERLTRALNSRSHLSAEQWQRLYVSLGVHAAVIAAIVEVLDRA